MNEKRVVLGIMLCGTLVGAMGCATESCTQDFNSKVHSAHLALEEGRTQDAVSKLEEAETISSECSCDKASLERLKVEASLCLGNTVEAYDQAKQLLDAGPQDPFANELFGKICLTEGEFKRAETHFTLAQQAYENNEDISRARDLLALTRYFLAYQDANPRLAEQYMREIEDYELAHALDKARKDLNVARAN